MQVFTIAGGRCVRILYAVTYDITHKHSLRWNCELAYTSSQRMANDWNALPDAVVMSGSINQFKGRLGRWWKNDPILYQNITSPQVTKHSAIAIYNAREGHQPC